jgi:hypothetical protein
MDGFSVDENNALHWSSPALLGLEGMEKTGQKEAMWALKPKDAGIPGYELWAQLACPNLVSQDHSFHSMMTIGTVKVVLVQTWLGHLEIYPQIVS